MATVLFKNGVAIAPMAPDNLSSNNQIAITDTVRSGAFLPSHDPRLQIASIRYEGRPVSRSPEQLHLHPVLDEIGLQSVVAELNHAALSGAQSIASEPVLITTRQVPGPVAQAHGGAKWGAKGPTRDSISPFGGICTRM